MYSYLILKYCTIFNKFFNFSISFSRSKRLLCTSGKISQIFRLNTFVTMKKNNCVIWEQRPWWLLATCIYDLWGFYNALSPNLSLYLIQNKHTFNWVHLEGGQCLMGTEWELHSMIVHIFANTAKGPRGTEKYAVFFNPKSSILRPENLQIFSKNIQRGIIHPFSSWRNPGHSHDPPWAWL